MIALHFLKSTKCPEKMERIWLILLQLQVLKINIALTQESSSFVLYIDDITVSRLLPDHTGLV